MFSSASVRAETFSATRFLPVFSAAHHRRSHITNKRRHQRSGAIRGVALGVTPKLVI
jgi:hypothetical protein